MPLALQAFDPAEARRKAAARRAAAAQLRADYQPHAEAAARHAVPLTAVERIRAWSLYRDADGRANADRWRSLTDHQRLARHYGRAAASGLASLTRAHDATSTLATAAANAARAGELDPSVGAATRNRAAELWSLLDLYADDQPADLPGAYLYLAAQYRHEKRAALALSDRWEAEHAADREARAAAYRRFAADLERIAAEAADADQADPDADRWAREVAAESADREAARETLRETADRSARADLALLAAAWSPMLRDHAARDDEAERAAAARWAATPAGRREARDAKRRRREAAKAERARVRAERKAAKAARAAERRAAIDRRREAARAVAFETGRADQAADQAAADPIEATTRPPVGDATETATTPERRSAAETVDRVAPTYAAAPPVARVAARPVADHRRSLDADQYAEALRRSGDALAAFQAAGAAYARRPTADTLAAFEAAQRRYSAAEAVALGRAPLTDHADRAETRPETVNQPEETEPMTDPITNGGGAAAPARPLILLAADSPPTQPTPTPTQPPAVAEEPAWLREMFAGAPTPPTPTERPNGHAPTRRSAADQADHGRGRIRIAAGRARLSVSDRAAVRISIDHAGGVRVDDARDHARQEAAR